MYVYQSKTGCIPRYSVNCRHQLAGSLIGAKAPDGKRFSAFKLQNFMYKNIKFTGYLIMKIIKYMMKISKDCE